MFIYFERAREAERERETEDPKQAPRQQQRAHVGLTCRVGDSGRLCSSAGQTLGKKNFFGIYIHTYMQITPRSSQQIMACDYIFFSLHLISTVLFDLMLFIDGGYSQ